MRALALLLFPLTLAACSPKAAIQAVVPISLDCTKPFETVKAEILAQPGLMPEAVYREEPYRYVSTADGSATWVITEPGAPGHPAIIVQRVRMGTTEMRGCPYGEARGYLDLLEYLEGLKAARK